MDVINIHQHSHYSRLDAAMSVESIVERNEKLGASAVALTEHGTLASSYELWKTCNKKGIKPIIGLEAYYVDKYGTEAAEIPYCYSHVVLIAKNEKGWENLKLIQSHAWEHGYLRKPRVDFNLLKKYKEGLIVTSACMGGIISGIYLGFDKYYADVNKKKRIVVATKRLKKFKRVFGDDFYLEVQLNDCEGYVEANKFIIKLSKKYNIPIIVTNDSHYVSRKDAEIHDVVKCVAFRKTLFEENNGTYGVSSLYILGFDGYDSFRIKWHDDYVSRKQLTEWCKNTKMIADKVENYPIRPNVKSLPKFCKNSNKELEEVCNAGFQEKIAKSKWKFYVKVRKNKKLLEYKKRLNHELTIIKQLGFSDYYLMVWDIVNKARALGIPFNMRGSVCGSMAAFCCGISWIDPIRFDCPFERFLTEDRISMPDMDMDFSRSRREEMISYVKEKYGNECVAHIENFSKWKVKGVIKDVSRVHGIPFQEVNEVTKRIPDDVEKFEDIGDDLKFVKDFFDKNEDIERLSKRMLGLVCGAGVHASGIILTPEPLDKWTPVAYMTEKASEKKKPVRVTEWDMYALEELDILKLDFLGLRNLDIVSDAINLIIKSHKTKFNDLDTLYEHVLDNIDDDNVFEMCRKGELIGTFQMGTSDGMRQLIIDMKPTTIDDIIASIALYRTAVLRAGMHTQYVKRKFGAYYKAVHPKLDKVFKETYGVMLYQEQCMKAAVVMAGFTVADSDHFRKGIKQKDPEKFAVWKNKFIKGCVKYSKTTKEKANEIWDFIENFSGYGFNKSHSASYAILSYITAYLKHYYPIEYMCAVLSSSMDDDKKLAIYMGETKRMKLKIKSPDINISGEKFKVYKGTILYPFSAVKQCGEKVVEAILGERKSGKFMDFEDFFVRINKRVVNVGVMTNLILSGCFRKFGKIHKVYDLMMELRKDKISRSLYCNTCGYRYPIIMKGDNVSCPDCGSDEVETDLEDVKGKRFNSRYCSLQTFGFSMEENPLKRFAARIMKEDCEALEEVEGHMENDQMKIACRIVSIREHVDKRGGKMAFLNIDNGSYTADLTVFSSDWEIIGENVVKGGCYIVKVKKNRGNNFLFFGGNEDHLIRLI